MKWFTKEVQIALVAIVGIVVLYVGLQFLKGLSLTSDDTYYAAFDDVSGLSSSSPVYANGYRVGVVKAINFNYKENGKIVVAVGLDKNMQLPVGSRAEIESDMMGNLKLNIILSDNPIDHLAAGDTIQGGANQGLMAAAGAMLPKIAQMLPKLDSILTSVNALLADPALSKSLHNIESMTTELNATSRDLHTMVGGLNRQLPSMVAKADGVLTGANNVTAQLAGLDIAGTMTKVNTTLDNVAQMTAALNSRDGTLGLLMHDPQLYINLNGTMRSADSLLTDLKAHPKRYVHFSLFGKKDK